MRTKSLIIIYLFIYLCIHLFIHLSISSFKTFPTQNYLGSDTIINISERGNILKQDTKPVG